MKSDERKEQEQELQRLLKWAHAALLRFEEAEGKEIILPHDQGEDFIEVEVLRLLAKHSPDPEYLSAYIARLTEVVGKLQAQYPHIRLPSLETNPDSIP